MQTSKNYANYKPQQPAYINKTISIKSVRTAEQYEGLQKSFPDGIGPNGNPTGPEVAACQYDLYEQEKINGKCTLTSVAQQPNGNYIISCSCVVTIDT